MDADERKKELIEQNKINGGFLFKMEAYPRIIQLKGVKSLGLDRKIIIKTVEVVLSGNGAE